MSRIMKYFFLLIAIFTFNCASAQDERKIIVDNLIKQTVVKPDIQYNQSGRPLLLDIYYPAGFKGGSLPCIVWIHGGALIDTSLKKDYDLVRWGVAFSAIKGYIAVSIDYRLLGEAPLPAAIEDCNTAIRFLKAKAIQYHIDTTRIGVVGESAGGYLAGFCAFAGNTSKFKTKDWENYSNRVKCAVLWYPATNHDPYNMIDYISKGDAPVMLIHGDKDKLVPISHSYSIKKGCNDNNIPVEMVIIDGADHGFFDPDGKFDVYRKNMERAVNLTIDFFKRQFGK
jgi:acetyl esterase/lipase